MRVLQREAVCGQAQGSRGAPVRIAGVHALVNPLCFHLWGVAEIVLGCRQLPSAGSAVQQIIADNCLETAIYLKKKKSETRKNKRTIGDGKGRGN